MMTIFMFALLLCGVFVDEVKSVSVMEGDSVTLHTEFTGIQRDYIKWWFGPEGSSSLLIHIDESTPEIKNVEGFKDRLQISDIQTGDLIIKNMKKKHTGLYRAEISRSTGTFWKKFNVIVYNASGEIDCDTGEVMSVSETVGGSVILNTDVNLQRDALILWRFGPKSVLIAKDDTEDSKTPEYPEVLNGSFKGRLKLNDQTGALIISNVRYEDSGDYKLKISSNKQIIHKTFSVSIRGVVTDEMSVNEGDSVTLHTNITDKQRDEILWRFGSEGSSILLVHINGTTSDIKNVEGFKERLQISDIHTGDLTIKNMKKKYAGLYIAEIEGADGTITKRFNVVVNEAGPSSGVIAGWVFFITAAAAAAAAVIFYRHRISKKKLEDEKKKLVDEHMKLLDKMKTIDVCEGYSLLLDRGDDIQTNDVIECSFEETPIAKIKGNTPEITPKGVEIFGDHRLQMNKRSGDLKINDISMKHAGLYKVKIISSKGTSSFLINVIVKARVLTVQLGGSVTVPTGLKQIQTRHDIKWFIKPSENKLLAKIHETNELTGISESSKEISKDRLTMDRETGDLTINKVTAEDTGVYTLLHMTGKRQRQRNYYVAIFVSGNKGENVTLETGSELQVDTDVEWSFSHEVNLYSEDKKILVTGIIGQSSDTKYARRRFKCTLEMNTETGDLTIKNIKRTDAGFYTLKLIKTDGEILYRIFKVDVNASSGDEQSSSDDDEDPQASKPNIPVLVSALRTSETVNTVYDVVSEVEKGSARTNRNELAVEMPLLKKVR